MGALREQARVSLDVVRGGVGAAVWRLGRLDHSLSVADPGVGSPQIGEKARCSLRPDRMDYFLAICQAIGWALAIGALAGAFVPRSGAAAMLLAAAAIGAAVGAVSMSTDDEGIIGGLVVGALVAPLAALVVASIVSGASRRTDGSSGALGFIVALVAVAMAALCLLVSPIALVALVAVAWLALARRRRSERKYEGLRILR